MKITRTPNEFVEESLLLLKARPATAKVTTSYHAAESSKGKLTLKTWDPVSGAAIKFRTDKIADVGRMLAGLNKIGRHQAGVPEPVVTDTLMPDASGTPLAGTPGTRTPVPGQNSAPLPDSTPAAAAAGKGKKKKKGKK